MADGYQHRPTGEAGFRQILKDQQRQIDNLRGAHKLFSAIIGAGGITIQDGGGLVVTDKVGRLLTLAPGSFSVYTLDGTPTGITPPFTSIDPGTLLVGDLNGFGRVKWDDANTRMQLLSTTGRISVEHFTTAAAANAVLDAVTGVVSRSTSSARYKQDIKPAAIDPADVLKIQGRTWRQRADVEGMDPDADTERRFVGFVAEELYEIPSMRQFVNVDEDGQPDSIETDRISVALLELAKSQQKQLDVQADQIAALTKRLDALEGKA